MGDGGGRGRGGEDEEEDEEDEGDEEGGADDGDEEGEDAGPTGLEEVDEADMREVWERFAGQPDALEKVGKGLLQMLMSGEGGCCCCCCHPATAADFTVSLRCSLPISKCMTFTLPWCEFPCCLLCDALLRCVRRLRW